MNSRGLCCFFAFLVALAGAVCAAPSLSPSASPSPAPQIDPKLFSGMQWRQVGPFRGGRALAIEGVPGEPNTWYFGAVAGGVWKTLDGGANWTPLFDKQDISSIGAIAVAPSDHNTIYVGTGEAAIRGNTTYGTGVYKSVDAGKNWKNIGLRDTSQIGALIVHPKNPDIVLVAALGHAFGPNAERGIFRTSDGGKTWTKVLSKDENTGGIDVVFDPHNPNVVFASLWQARRQPWFFSSGGPGSGLYKSEDNGVSWKQLTGNGLPDGILGRIGISVSGADSNRVYAIIEAKEGGKTWTTQNNQPTAQFYHVATDNAYPYHIYGAQQDNSNVGIASRSESGVITAQDWFVAGGGECGFVVPDPRDWHIIYSNSEGLINRYDKKKEEVQDVSPVPLDNSGHGAVDLIHRFQWVSPLMLSPHNPDVLYTAAECVFKSSDHGQSWTQISGDLTRNDKSKQQPSGGPLTNDITSVEYYDTVIALAESPVNKGTIWAGTDDGLVQVTSDDGQHWSNVTPKMPQWSTIDLIEASPHDGNTAYLAVDRHNPDSRSGDQR